MILNFETNNITIANFDEITNVLTGNAINKRKGMHWIVEDLANDATTFNSKTLTLEFSVQNARPGTSNPSWIDVYCNNCNEDGLQLLIEYKHGPNSITTGVNGTIKKQFIERDLFNATNLNQLQYRLKDTGFTKELLNQELIQQKTAIESLGVDKIAELLDDASNN